MSTDFLQKVREKKLINLNFLNCGPILQPQNNSQIKPEQIQETSRTFKQYHAYSELNKKKCHVRIVQYFKKCC